MFSFCLKKRIILFISLIVVCSIMACAIFAMGALSDAEPEMSIEGINLSFSESIYVIYAVSAENISDTNNVKMLIWRDPQSNYIAGTEDASLSSSSTEQVNGKECFIFNYKDIDAKEMTEVVYARACYIDGDNTYYSDVKKYSVLQYVYNKLGYTGTPTNDKSLSNLLNGLLEYGASAQIFFDHNVTDLANEKHVMIRLNNGTFGDGTSSSLVLPGTHLSFSADESEDKMFVHWEDENGEVISQSTNLEIVAGESNKTYTAIYETFSGGEIEGAGASLSESSFAMSVHSFDHDSAVDVTANEMQEILASGIFDAKVYRVDGELVLFSSLNADGIAIIASEGILIENAHNISLSNLFVSGKINVRGSSNVKFKNIDVSCATDAIIIDAESNGIIFDDCRIISNATAINCFANEASVINSYIKGGNAVVALADGTTIYNNVIISASDAITVSGEDIAINNNTVTASHDSVGIIVKDKSLNTLVSFNKLENMQTSVQISSSVNTSVLFNSAYKIIANSNTNLYIVENSLGNKLSLTSNNYLLCDANKYVDDIKDHSPYMLENTNVNGDNVTDVNARAEVGANEDILPHTNKDLYLDMQRKATVKDVIGGSKLDLNAYIETNAKVKSIVIVPPGAYVTAAGDPMEISADMSNTEIYAFGVYNEHGFNTDEEYLAKKGVNQILTVGGAENVTLHGITLGYDYQSSGQVHVLKKLDDRQILVIPAAGYDIDAGFGKSNTGVFSASYTSKYGAGTSYSALGGTGYTFVSRNNDGTLILKMNDADSYNAMNIGDIITCRMAGDNQHTIGISSSKNVKLKDVVLHGYSAALMTVVTGNSTGTALERVHNTARAPYVIDKETYDKYDALEKEYGVDLEIYIDSMGRYRGSLPRVGSVDATHVSGASEGLDITSCLFENMCDDGSNQRGGSSRLADVKDNGDGTTTLYFKGMVTSTYHGIDKGKGKTSVSKTPGSFSKGDLIYVYTSNGELLCDTVCLTSAKDEDDRAEIYDFDSIRYFIYTKSVKVPTEAVNFDALEGYDLADNHYDMKNKVLVDNISHCSEGFVIDNLMVRNSTARGVLIKTINATVKNSTFRNVTGTGNLLSVETSWGESTVARNAVISNCLFESTGISVNDPIRAPIAISGLSTYGNANVDTLRASNILITGCEFKNYGHDFGIYVNGAQDVRIIDNVFDPKDEAAPGHFIKILTALNVEISGNKYRDASNNLSMIGELDADDYTYIHGDDVGDRYRAKCDIYIGNKHLSSMRIYPQDRSYRDVASIMADKLANVCGYAVSYSSFYKDDVIKLVVTDPASELISSDSYTVTCDGENLIITAATKASLVYAVEDFVNYIAELNKTNQSITFEAGYDEKRTFNVKSALANDTETFKYSGIWSANGTSMKSVADADYVEFDIKGASVTLLFSAKSEFDISIDGANAKTYTVEKEKTFYFENAEHTIRISAKDTSDTVSFAGIKYLDSIITRTKDKEHYIQFVGDSMVDSNNSFAHMLGKVLDWDYSVVVGTSIPSSADIGRSPDVFVIFLGTDAITSDSTNSEIAEFKATYKKLIESIVSRYPNYKKIFLMQALSTSDADNMFNVSHKRYSAIASLKSYTVNSTNDNISIATNSKISLIDAATVLSWGIEFDAAKDTTNPTDKGKLTLLAKLSNHIATDPALGIEDYVNTTFELGKMKNYNGRWTKNVMEDGLTFNRYNFDKNGHVFISGSDYADISTNSGRYLIIKYRTSGDYTLSINVRTNDYGTNLPESGKGYVSSKTKPTVYVPTDWEIAVIDLDQFVRYTVGIDTKVQIRFTTTLSTIDIAHVSIVDDMKEARLLIMSQFNAEEFMMYEDWSLKGVKTSIDGSTVEEEASDIAPDMSFVNHNFNLVTMKMYSAGKGIVVPTATMITDENGIMYNRFEFTQRGHIFLKGSNTLTEINGKTGNYLVIKYRAQNNSDLTLEMQTSDLPFNSTYPYRTMSTSKKAPTKVSTEWEVAVIDLSKFPAYQRDTDLDVLIRITTTCSYVDIAYSALVDDIAEAEKYISIMGDKAYNNYADWSKDGTSTVIK